MPAVNEQNVVEARNARDVAVLEETNLPASYVTKLRGTCPPRRGELRAPAATMEEAIIAGGGVRALKEQCRARCWSSKGDDPRPSGGSAAAAGAAGAGRAAGAAGAAGAETVDMRRPAAGAAASTLVMPQPSSLDSIATRSDHPNAHCVMCGKEGMDPKEASETSANVVVIPKQQIKLPGPKREIFEGRLHAAKCNKAADPKSPHLSSSCSRLASRH